MRESRTCLVGFSRELLPIALLCMPGFTSSVRGRMSLFIKTLIISTLIFIKDFTWMPLQFVFINPLKPISIHAVFFTVFQQKGKHDIDNAFTAGTTHRSLSDFLSRHDATS